MKDDEMERAREWRVNPETPSVIITPHGRISIGWSAQREGQFSDFTLAEETAAMIVRAVNAFAQQSKGWVLVPREPTPAMLAAAMSTSGMQIVDSILVAHQARGYRIDEEKFAPNNVAPLSQAWSAMLDVAPIPGEE